ncbi:hypothetical protein Sjap_002976 [Stephania japonica]|uniref:Cytochrome P450 n=1 Tax=Stephania japonica TaxID=461633 RepID=A0AAP0KMV4_9MAGN
MVVKEILRLHPPAPLLIPRECMDQCKVNGYDISPGTWVMVNMWAIGRNHEYWDNPDEFCPERFKNSSIDYKGQDFEFLPFGGGRRICPALNLGMLHVELSLANLLCCFDWALPSGMNVEDIEMDEEGGLAVHKKSPLFLLPIKYNCEAISQWSSTTIIMIDLKTHIIMVRVCDFCGECSHPTCLFLLSKPITTISKFGSIKHLLGRYDETVIGKEENSNADTSKTVILDELSIMDEYWSEPQETLEVSLYEPDIGIE